MKITPKIFSVPPYLSTTWKNISSLHVKEEGGAFRLVVVMHDGPVVEIPGLGRSDIHTIFEAHARFAEADSEEQHPVKTEESLSFTLPFMKDGKQLSESFGASAQHNPDQSDLPPLPEAVLKKISAIAQAFGADTLPNFPKAEPDCNCMYCQVMRAVQGENVLPAEIEEEVTAEDLKFRNWEVRQTADKLYIVTNPIDQNENYSVYLGEPIGCTCGSKSCEHVRAVLST